jgi:hypothetical protein
LYWFLQRTGKALKSFQEAFEILKITHGTDSKIMSDLQDRLAEATVEYQFKTKGQPK